MPPKSSTKGSKDASTKEETQTYNESDIVLAKVKGYPPWPGRVMDPSAANKKVAKEKPSKGKNHYLVQFFPTGDFTWAGPRDLSLLQTKEIEKYLSEPSKKKSDLRQGYEIAKDPSQWITEKDDQAAELERLQAQVDEDEDELASESEQPQKKGAAAKGGKKETATKKRKRESNAKGENGTAKKDEKKKPKKDTTKTKAGVKKDYTDDEAEPASKKAKASGDSDSETVKSWRHKLQKIFLGKTDPPTNEMSNCAEIFDHMEKFEMKKEYLIESKLAKVLKRIALLKEGAIPEDDKYDFRKRSSELATKWAAILGPGEKSDAAQPAPESSDNKESTTDNKKEEETNGVESTSANVEGGEKEDAPAAAASEEKKEDSDAMQVDENGGDAPAEEKNTEGEEPKKDEEEEPATESSA
ncbi:uncharacterized protein JCM6883_000020 [Sporobolomyces salmoneus]|uniref:uncharacterized protein n=1 Tax=Sporobolomyces salmoneus TaxID=183962 RepID=UPI003179596E